MSHVYRYLITTSDESTWKFDRPVLFLGEWCRKFDRKHIWQNMDGIVAEAYGLSQFKKDEDFSRIQKLDKKLFPKFCLILNQHHQTHYSERYWRIVLGHWFYRIINILSNRVNTLDQCLKKYKISGTCVYNNDNFDLATMDSFSTPYISNNCKWNNVINKHILNLLEINEIKVDVIKDTGHAIFNLDILSNNKNIFYSIFLWVGQRLFNFMKLFVRETDAFIIKSYLPRKTQIFLQLSLKQFPMFWQTLKFNFTKRPDRKLRRKLSNKFFLKAESKIENIILNLLFELIPVCYLEEFKNINLYVENLPWPKNPKFIFTSNSFDNDEVFKFWTANKVEKGIKYYVGQHGGEYGTLRNPLHPCVEENTADKFLTWGWKGNLPQHKPAFMLSAIANKLQYNKNGGLLLLEQSKTHRVTLWDETREFHNYFNDQKKFISNLNAIPKEKLTLRLHIDHLNQDWSELARWYEFDQKLKIDDGTSNIRNLIAKSRLIVHSYDSTSLLETLSQNIPTIAFWQNGLDHLTDEARSYYQILVDAGIIYFDSNAAAEKINNNWDNLTYWWEQDKIQKARKKFCDKYARKSQKPLKDLLKAIKI